MKLIDKLCLFLVPSSSAVRVSPESIPVAITFYSRRSFGIKAHVEHLLGHPVVSEKVQAAMKIGGIAK